MVLSTTPNKDFYKKVAVKEHLRHRSSYLLSETVAFCSEWKWSSIEQVVLV